MSELAALMGTTKQAASKLVETMVAAGYVQRMRRDLVRVLSDTSSGELPPVRPIW